MGLDYREVADFFGEWDVEVSGEVARVHLGPHEAVVGLPNQPLFLVRWELVDSRLVLDGVDWRGVDFQVELDGVDRGVSAVDLVRYVQGGSARRDRDGSKVAVAGDRDRVELGWRGERIRARRTGGTADVSESGPLLGNAAMLSSMLADGHRLTVASGRTEFCLSRAVGAIDPELVLDHGSFQHARVGEIGVIVLDESLPTRFTEVWMAVRGATAGLAVWPLVVGEDWDRGSTYAPPLEVIVNEASQIDPSTMLGLDRELFAGADEELPGLVSGDVSVRGEALLSVDTHSQTLVGRPGAPEWTSIGTEYLVVVPGSSGAEALAAIGWSDGNTLSSAQHVAVLDHFERIYGAKLAAIDGSGIDLMLDTPLADPVAATSAALERLSYGDTTGNGTAFFVTGDELSVARATMRDHVWSFWWD